MKVFTDGSRHWGAQLPRIEDGFRQLGHEITTDSSAADLLYSNDMAHYDFILSEKLAGRAKGRVIFTVLDLPLHNKDTFDFEGLAKRLAFADRVCSISQYVQWQLSSYLAVDSTVIWQPIKPVSLDLAAKVLCPYRFASVGRRHDLNKNCTVWAAALQLLSIPHTEVALTGNEPGWGDHLGVQSDKDLNHLYNSVDFVMCLGTVEGLNLPMVEAMACGAIPVCHKGLTTLDEFLPADLFPEYREVELTPPSVARFIARFLNSAEAMVDMKARLHIHYQDNWTHRLSGKAVAQAIVNVYDAI